MKKIRRFIIPDWVKKYRENIWLWFNKQSENNPSYLRLCTKGDLLKPSHHSGLGWTALGLKLFHILEFSQFEKNLKIS